MPVILIEHPEHGRHYVYTLLDLKEHEAIGWRKVEPKAAPQPKPKRRR